MATPVRNGTLGNDIFYGLEGLKITNGLGGLDTLNFVKEAGKMGVNVNLDKLVAFDSTGFRATINGITDVVGSFLSDRITGNKLDNSIWGEAGDDNIQGLGGNDRLYGGTGNDRLDGGDRKSVV